MWAEGSGPWEERDTITRFEGEFETRGALETENVGAELARTLKGGETIALFGELGSGKTTFIRGLARGLGVADASSVKSPSYTLVLSYPGRLPLLHLDAYFMHSPDDVDLCGMDEFLARGGVVAVEWAERVTARLPKGALSVELEHQGLNERRIRIGRCG
jgi:tRNA threonylcarbamoyladenosine biosynthesis protein TsaE